MVRMSYFLSALIILFCFTEMVKADPLKLKFGVDVEEKYSDNVFFEADDPQYDFITRLKPWLWGGWRTETSDIMLRGKADIYDYRKNDELNAIDQSYEAELARRWNSRFATSLTASYLNDERRERELAETGLLFDDDNRQRQSYILGAQCNLTELSAMSLSYNYQIETFDDELTYDLHVHMLQWVFSRDLTSIIERSTGSLSLVGGLYEYRRDYETTDPFFGAFQTNVDDEQTIDYYALRVGMAHNRTERLKLNVDLGARFTRRSATVIRTISPNPLSLSVPVAEEEKESWGYVATLEAVYTGEKWEFSALASHDLVPASGRNGTTERTTLRLGGSGRVVSQWFYDWSMRGYLNSSDNSGVTSNEDEMTVQLQGGLRFAFNPQWSLGVYWLTSWIDDRENDIDRTQNTLSLRLMWNLPVLD
jgi:hypothetical protein